ncbi:unnamed protein product [Chrysoparadoxa australica]
MLVMWANAREKQRLVDHGTAEQHITLGKFRLAGRKYLVRHATEDGHEESYNRPPLPRKGGFGAVVGKPKAIIVPPRERQTNSSGTYSRRKLQDLTLGVPSWCRSMDTAPYTYVGAPTMIPVAVVGASTKGKAAKRKRPVWPTVKYFDFSRPNDSSILAEEILQEPKLGRGDHDETCWRLPPFILGATLNGTAVEIGECLSDELTSGEVELHVGHPNTALGLRKLFKTQAHEHPESLAGKIKAFVDTTMQHTHFTSNEMEWKARCGPIPLNFQALLRGQGSDGLPEEVVVEALPIKLSVIWSKRINVDLSVHKEVQALEMLLGRMRTILGEGLLSPQLTSADGKTHWLDLLNVPELPTEGRLVATHVIACPASFEGSNELASITVSLDLSKDAQLRQLDLLRRLALTQPSPSFFCCWLKVKCDAQGGSSRAGASAGMQGLKIFDEATKWPTDSFELHALAKQSNGTAELVMAVSESQPKGSELACKGVLASLLATLTLTATEEEKLSFVRAATSGLWLSSDDVESILACFEYDQAAALALMALVPHTVNPHNLCGLYATFGPMLQCSQQKRV